MGIRPKRTRRRKPKPVWQRHLLSLGIALGSGSVAFSVVTLIAHPKSQRAPASLRPSPATPPNTPAEAILAIREEAHQILLDYQATGGPRFSIPKDLRTPKTRYELADAGRLESLGKKLHSLEPRRFPEENSWRSHLADLLGEISGTGPALSKWIQLRHGSSDHRAAIQDWNEAMDRIQNPVTEDDPRIQAIQDEALGLLLERSNSGPPQPRPNPDPAPESLEAEDRRHLEELSLRLHRLSAEQFPITGGIANIAILMERIPNHGETLAKLIRTPRRKSATFLPLHQEWLKQVEAIGLIHFEEPKPVKDRRPPGTHHPINADVQGLKESAKTILDRYPDTAIPIWNSLPGLTPQERRLRKLDFTALVSISARLAKREPERFIAKNNLENLARLFENDGPEGEALAALFRTNRITEAKQFPERVRSWQQARDARKLFDCLETRLESP
jgi:hypothetical protein